MRETRRERVLMVDDEPNLLATAARVLRNSEFEVQTAERPTVALELLKNNGPWAVVVSDLRMPEMDGITLLRTARATAPETVRVLLTGQLDLAHAIAAVNQGEIFRFLTKPCPPVVLSATLRAAAEQYRLVTAERVLLEETLRGCVQALVDLLALVAPAALGRAARLRRTVSALARAAHAAEAWKCELAAMLSQLGCVVLPQETLDKLMRGDPLDARETEMVRRMPATLEQVLGHIPRLEAVLEILRQVDPLPPCGDAPAAAGPASWGARALQLALDLDVLESQGHARARAFEILRAREGRYEAALIDTLAHLNHVQRTERVVALALDQLRPGMTLVENVYSKSGVLVVARGFVVTPSLLDKINYLALGVGIVEPIRVAVPELGDVPHIAE